MALQGTIDDFPLTDVLSLLASSSRSGRLLLDGDRGSATLVIDQGHVVGGGPGHAAADAPALVFELLRHREGAFGFEAVEPVVDPLREVDVDPRPVAGCLEDAGQLLERWQAIEAVVPSSSCLVRLVPELPGDSIELDAKDWRTVAGVGHGMTVEQLRDHLSVDEFSLCEQLADLAGSGLLLVDEPETTADRPIEPSEDSPALHHPDDPTVEDQELVPWADTEPGSGLDGRSVVAKDESSVGWLLSEDDREEFAPADECADEDGVASGVPERFPIDDLLGEPGGGDEDPWASPEMEQLQQQRAQPVDEAVEFEPVPFDSPRSPEGSFADEGGDSADEVLRQMSKLSPEAAEAIAAALNSPPASSVPAGEEPDDDGPVTYIGTL